MRYDDEFYFKCKDDNNEERIKQRCYNCAYSTQQIGEMDWLDTGECICLIHNDPKKEDLTCTAEVLDWIEGCVQDSHQWCKDYSMDEDKLV